MKVRLSALVAEDSVELNSFTCVNAVRIDRPQLDIF